MSVIILGFHCILKVSYDFPKAVWTICTYYPKLFSLLDRIDCIWDVVNWPENTSTNATAIFHKESKTVTVEGYLPFFHVYAVKSLNGEYEKFYLTNETNNENNRTWFRTVEIKMKFDEEKKERTVMIHNLGT